MPEPYMSRLFGENVRPQQLPEAYPGLEVAYPEGLEVDWRTPNFGEKLVVESQTAVPYEANGTVNDNPQKRGCCSSRKIVCFLAVVVVILAAILVPVGVLVIRKRGPDELNLLNEFSKDSPATSSSSSPLPPAPSTPSKDGVFKGTRLAAMDPRSGGDIFLYYQYGDGSLRYISLSASRDWQGSRSLPAKDSMAGTPLATTHTVSNGSTTWWLFYVDKSSIIQSIYSYSNPAEWHMGNVGNKRYIVPSQSSIAFTLARGRMFDTDRKDLGGGLTLFASDTEGRVVEYIYNENDESWNKGFTFANSNGYGSASVWSQANRAYLFTLSEAQLIGFWWRDYDDSENEDRNTWHLGPSSHAAVAANASMCGQYAFAYQAANGKIQGSNFTTLTKLQLMRWDTAYEISEEPAMDGSALSCWYYFPSEQKENTMFHTFYQVESGGIREAKRYWEADNATVPGMWRFNDVPFDSNSCIAVINE
ncbi:hypothetical protein AJ79_08147 [Helicocarpus griseus UAMH5409]|uniref:Fucose-specific lectin n=1 Tax=Helicocarpus griseus UAMH5409 TaxID=1447875 RepID=A0A2B7WVW2_9EURO|nr:hypothetical protein AJ79_08147 [Helicocarpus griseus UAMH5409]